MEADYDKPEHPDEYTGVCFCCGYPLHKFEIAADLNGTIIDYIEHDQTNGRICFCSECYLRGQEYTNGGKEAAIRRVKLSINMTKSAVKKLEETTSTEYKC